MATAPPSAATHPAQRRPQASHPPPPTREAAAYTTTTAARTLPIYDLFLDLPHPAASSACPAPYTLPPPPIDDANDGSRAVAAELSDEKSVARITRFAFPEFDDNVNAAEQANKSPSPPNSGAGLNRHDVYAHTPNAPFSTHHTFAMQLSSGSRIYGHVRRYLPQHMGAKTRFDVGRRGVRAMVVLARGSGGERFYAALLRSIESISSQQMVTPTKLQPRASPQQAFLHGICHKHRTLCANYAAKQDELATKPNVLSMSGLEFGNRPYVVPVDTYQLLVPAALLHAHSETDALSTTSSHLLPLLRCVGVPNALRLLSALLCERRVVLTSRSPARLSGCARGALSMLAQGVLSWQHVYVPMLPPGMINYLAAPMPYLVGILASHAHLISRIPGLGEVLVINLDTNEMECLNMPNPTSTIPDLLRPAIQPDYDQQPYVSVAEILGQDLAESLKADRRSAYNGDNVQATIGAAASQAAGKANVLFKKAASRLKSQSRKYMEQRSSSNLGMADVVEEVMERNGSERSGSGGGGSGQSSRENSMHGGGGDPTGDGGGGVGPPVPAETNYTFGEGYENEASEEEARIAFTSFFLCFLGDMRWYLTQPAPGQPPQLDKDKFIAERRRAGDAEGTPMFPLFTYFVQSQIFEQFAKARVEEVRARRPVSKDAPLFLLSSNYLRVQRLDFGLVNVRRVTRQVAQTENPSQFLIDWQVDVRRRVMALTSNQRNEPAVPSAMAKLAQDCREVSSVLYDVMAVIWGRIRDSRGMQWKHGLYALQLLRELLLHGPITAVTEAEDGIDKIRDMKSHNFSRQQNSAQVRNTAAHVYDLVVDRAKLFNQRRAAADARRRQQLPRPRLSPNVEKVRKSLKIGIPFKISHDMLRPGNIAPRARVAPAPPVPAGTANATAAPPPAPPAPAMDLVNKSPPPVAKMSGPSHPVVAGAAPAPYASDLLDFSFAGTAPAHSAVAAPVVAQPDVFTTKSDVNDLADIFSAASVAPVPAVAKASGPAVSDPATPSSDANTFSTKPQPTPSAQTPAQGVPAAPSSIAGVFATKQQLAPSARPPAQGAHPGYPPAPVTSVAPAPPPGANGFSVKPQPAPLAQPPAARPNQLQQSRLPQAPLTGAPSYALMGNAPANAPTVPRYHAGAIVPASNPKPGYQVQVPPLQAQQHPQEPQQRQAAPSSYPANLGPRQAPMPQQLQQYVYQPQPPPHQGNLYQPQQHQQGAVSVPARHPTKRHVSLTQFDPMAKK